MPARRPASPRSSREPPSPGAASSAIPARRSRGPPSIVAARVGARRHPDPLADPRRRPRRPAGRRSGACARDRADGGAGGGGGTLRAGLRSTSRWIRSAPSMILTVGVAFILFFGGLGLSLPLLRTVSVGLGMLVVPGVMITAAITGTAAGIAFGLPVDAALLIGAVLAPTDPAILIPLFCANPGLGQAGTDRDRRVGLQRPHRRDPRPGRGGRRPYRRRLHHRGGGRLRAQPGLQHRARRRHRFRTRPGHLQQALGDLARVAGDRGAAGRLRRLLLARVGRRQRLPGRVRRRADRRQHAKLSGSR